MLGGRPPQVAEQALGGGRPHDLPPLRRTAHLQRHLLLVRARRLSRQSENSSRVCCIVERLSRQEEDPA
eukprot:27990-Rhodomonas_salina.1